MADASNQKKGLTTFGWLALGATAFALLRNRDRREKIVNSVRDFGGKVTGAADKSAATPAE